MDKPLVIYRLTFYLFCTASLPFLANYALHERVVKHGLPNKRATAVLTTTSVLLVRSTNLRSLRWGQ